MDKTIYLLIGPMGAGKTTYAHQKAADFGAIVLSKDAFNKLSPEELVYPLIVNYFASQGVNIILDSLHLRRQDRDPMRNIAKKYGYRLKYIQIYPWRALSPLSDRMFSSFERPARDEFDEIEDVFGKDQTT